MNRSRSYRLAGIATLLFAVCPSIELGLMAISDSREANSGHPVVIFPLLIFIIIALVLSSPWIIAGILLLRNSRAGKRLALVLTVPSAVLVVLLGGRAICGILLRWISDRDPDGFIAGLIFGPFALFGLMFCIAVWALQRSHWRD